MSEQMSQEITDEYDVVVVGAGPGGLSAAALLVEAGSRVLVVERESRHGGRASTVEMDGFLVPTGATGMELGGQMEELITRLGGKYDVLAAEPMQLLRVGRRYVNISSPVALKLTDWALAAFGPIALKRLRRRENFEQVTMADLLRRLPQRSRLRGAVRSVIASVYAVNLDEIPAHLVLRYFVEKGAFRRFGFGSRGTVVAWDELAAAITRKGGSVWLNTEVRAINVEAGRAVGVEVERSGKRSNVACRMVISDAGPTATLDLLDAAAIEPSWASTVRRDDVPAPMIVVDMASTRRLLPRGGGVFFTDAECLCCVGHLTESAPGLAPEGWRLYSAYGVPRPALGPYDAEAELAKMMAELADVMGGLDDVRILQTRVATGTLAPVRAPAGCELPWKTPVDGLYLVGDAVRDPGDTGMEACVTVAKNVAEQVLVELGDRRS